jgi:23S rRNA (adenine-N6)-dimethyltransferase
MYKVRRKLFSQNFLHSQRLVNKLVRNSSIGKNDLVLEIGPGNGIITEQLVKQAQHTLAVEIDNHWFTYLQNRFNSVDSVTLYQGDILNFRLPALPYKVFANIPFSVEGKIVRQLIDAKNPPDDCYLVMMKELAYRLSAPYKENLFSLSHKPWFDFSLYHHFQRTDFTPIPNVDAVILRFTKRKNPRISRNEQRQYQQFVVIGFRHGLPVGYNLKKIYGRIFTSRILGTLHINRKTKPTELSLQQWISLYQNFAKSSYQ